MRLDQWFETSKKTISEIAEKAKKPKETIRRHVRGLRTPEIDMMNFYFKISSGKVTPNDFILTDKLNTSQHFIYTHKKAPKNGGRK